MATIYRKSNLITAVYAENELARFYLFKTSAQREFHCLRQFFIRHPDESRDPEPSSWVFHGVGQKEK
jgi:hypothetical protein